MATRKKKSSKSEPLTVSSAPSAEATINILFDQPIQIQSPDLKTLPKVSTANRKKQRLKKTLEMEKIRSKAYSNMIDLAEQQFNIPIRKKSAPKQ